MISCTRNRTYKGGELERELEELRRKHTHTHTNTPLMDTYICEC